MLLLMFMLLLAVTINTTALHLNLPNSSNDSSKQQPQGVHFIRIQKTASTTFGEVIMPRFCTPRENCWGFWHTNGSESTAHDFKGALVTLLRDPVERTLSEFFFLRTADGRKNSNHPQWDFRNRTWLKRVASLPVDEALLEYLFGYPKNPSRNRQALYLLGFRDKTKPPGAVYDWDNNHEQLLNMAKVHLERLHAYGFSDCYIDSMRAIARPLGWPEDPVVDLAKKVRAREQNKVRACWFLRRYASAKARSLIPDKANPKRDVSIPRGNNQRKRTGNNVARAKSKGKRATNDAARAMSKRRGMGNKTAGNQTQRQWPGFPDANPKDVEELSRTKQPNDIVNDRPKQPMDNNVRRSMGNNVRRSNNNMENKRSPRASRVRTFQKEMEASRHMTWDSLLTVDIIKRIRELNAVDVDLVDYARMRFIDRFGLKCKPDLDFGSFPT